MPNIPEVTARPDVTPSNAGESAYQIAGRRVMALGVESGAREGAGIAAVGGSIKEAADVIDQHIGLSEISHAAAQGATLLNGLSKTWQDTAAKTDPNDQTVAPDFLEKTLEPTLETYVNGYSTEAGRRFALEQADRIRNRMAERTTVDMSIRAGDAMASNMKDVQNNLGATVMRDPNSLGAALDTVDSTINAITANHSNLTPEQIGKLKGPIRDEVRGELAKGAFYGVAQADPAHAVSLLGTAPFSDILSPTDAKALDTFAQAQVRIKQEDARFAQYQRKQQQEDTSQAQTSQYLKSLVDDNGNLTLKPGINQSILMDPKLMPNAKLELYRFNHSLLEASQEVKTDPTVAADLVSRVWSPDNPTTLAQIAAATEGKKLAPSFALELGQRVSTQGNGSMTKIADNPLVKSEMDKAGGMIRGNTDPGNQAVRVKTDQFKVDTFTTLQNAIIMGQDIAPYMDPKSPQYLFSPERVARYAPSKQEIANQVVAPQAQPSLTDKQKIELLNKAFGGGP